MSYSVFAGYYDLFTDDVDYPRRAAWIADVLRKNGLKDGLTLDLACGTGSLTWELAARGYEMIGVDRSPEMLMEAMAKAGDCPEEVRPPLFLCQEMASLDLYGTITAAVCTLDSINHLASLEEVEKTFGLVGLFMEKDGIFIFDVNTRHKHIEVLGDNSYVYENEEAMCVWRNSLSEDLTRVDIALDFFTLAEEDLYCRESEEFSEWYYSPEQLTAALEKAGFELLGRYGEFAELPPAEDCQRAVYVARKKILSQKV